MDLGDAAGSGASARPMLYFFIERIHAFYFGAAKIFAYFANAQMRSLSGLAAIAYRHDFLISRDALFLPSIAGRDGLHDTHGFLGFPRDVLCVSFAFRKIGTLHPGSGRPLIALAQATRPLADSLSLGRCPFLPHSFAPIFSPATSALSPPPFYAAPLFGRPRCHLSCVHSHDIFVVRNRLRRRERRTAAFISLKHTSLTAIFRRYVGFADYEQLAYIALFLFAGGLGQALLAIGFRRSHSPTNTGQPGRISGRRNRATSPRGRGALIDGDQLRPPGASARTGPRREQADNNSRQKIR